jgi:hypothetical protein
MKVRPRERSYVGIPGVVRWLVEKGIFTKEEFLESGG